MPEYFDLVVIVPLEEELQEVMNVFEGVEDLSTETEFRYSVQTGVPGLNALIVQQEDMGKKSAVKSTSGILDEFGVGLAVSLGIAGGISKDLKLGDVCYSGTIIDVLDNSKALDNSDDGYVIEISPSYYKTNLDITAAFNFIRTIPDLKPLYWSWVREQEAFVEGLNIPAIKGRSSTKEKIGQPRSIHGNIVCGAVSKSEAYNKKLLAVDRKILAIDTESGGVFERATANGVAALTIRGISDYADEGKTSLEDDSLGAVRRVAAANAATFLKLQLSNDRFVNALIRLRDKNHSGQSDQLEIFPLAIDDVSVVLGELGLDVDQKLRELSPEFRLQPTGYRLPIPRVRPIDYQNYIGESFESHPIEVRDALRQNQVLLFNIPRTYPDQSLAWVIADDLLTAEISGKQALPIVIDGSAIRPPKSGFERYAGRSIRSIENVEGTQLVLIIENIPFHSKSRLRFLIEQTRSFKKAQFIFIDRSDVNIKFESDFVSETSASVYDICEVSFVEISHFVQKNFKMTETESEVVALRLKETFTKFDLPAHPTYFAGIPRETLSALLQANRRAELIQLAVDGFLTFVVADDTADITLSRTTRSRFLKRLTVAINLEKQSFNQEELVAFTNSFSKEFDFEIDPISFLQSFSDKGLIHFQEDTVKISLPFIESYLLASELSDDEPRALNYFRIEEQHFDLGTFDLYAEIGASKKLVENTIKALRSCVAELQATGNQTHILLTGEVQPTMLAKQDRLRTLTKQLYKAIEDVRSNSGNKEEKQRLLDLADQVRESTAIQTEQIKDREPNDGQADQERIEFSVHVWAIGAVLLGSGAEHLDAETKRELSSLLVQLAALFVDQWTRIHTSVDFSEVKQELTSDDAIDSFIKKVGIDEDVEKTRKFVGTMVEALEMTVLAEPIRKTIHFLSEQARHKVLAKSISEAKIDGELERVICAAWLTDLDSKRGRKELSKAIAELPRAPFLRVALTTHFLTRVYWSHWQSENRLALLDAAEQLMRPLNVHIDKSGLKRLIEHDEVSKRSSTDPGEGSD